MTAEAKSLITLDPGLREAGAAYFYDGEFMRCVLLEGEDDTDVRDVRASQAIAADARRKLFAAPVDQYHGQIAYERMQHYRGQGKAKVDDLFQLTGVTHAVIAPLVNASEITGYLPDKWTSGRPKSVNHDRIRRRLKAEETERLVNCLDAIPESDHEHVLDAIGIGLYHLKRL